MPSRLVRTRQDLDIIQRLLENGEVGSDRGTYILLWKLPHRLLEPTSQSDKPAFLEKPACTSWLLRQQILEGWVLRGCCLYFWPFVPGVNEAKPACGSSLQTQSCYSFKLATSDVSSGP